MSFRHALLAFTILVAPLPALASAERIAPRGTTQTSATETRSHTLAEGESLDRLLHRLEVPRAQRIAALAALKDTGIAAAGGARITARINTAPKGSESLSLLRIATPHRPSVVLIAHPDDVETGALRSVRGTVGPDFPGFLASLRVPHPVIESIVAALPSGQPEAGQRFRLSYRVSGSDAALSSLTLSGHGGEVHVGAFAVGREAALAATNDLPPPVVEKRESRESRENRESRDIAASRIPKGDPLPGGRLTSPWGWRIHPVLKRPQFHMGVDYSAPAGTPVRATADGQVTFVGKRGNYGRLIRLSHDDGIATGYAHLQDYAKGLKVGAKVRKGDIIGYVGRSGLATGNHLYYEVFADGKQIDPLAGRGDPSRHMTEAENRHLRQALAQRGIMLD